MIIAMVLIVFFLMLCLLIFATDNKRDIYRLTCRWVGVLAMIGVIGNAGHALAEWIPRMNVNIEAYGPFFSGVMKWGNWLYVIFTILSYYALPYAFLMFTIAFNPKIPGKRHKPWLFILLIPFLVSLLYSLIHVQVVFPRWFVVLWIVPYLVFGCVLLVHGYVAEGNRTMRRYRLLICCGFIPIMCLVMLKDYILPVFGIAQAGLISWSIGISTIVFVTYYCIRFGMLGVQIRFEKERIIGSVRAVVSSTSMLNHAIKNEIGKIDFQLNKIAKLASHTGAQDILHEVDIARNSTIHLLEVVKRIEYHSRVLEIKEEYHSLVEILERSLHTNAAFIERENVYIKTDYQLRPLLLCDRVHIQEAFNNILMNALEALEGLDTRKVIDITIRGAGKEICVIFKDYGKGMDKDLLPLVLEPFFSTKKNRQNFGLGLSYCQQVMEKHRGRIEFSSHLHEGTTVTLCFPSARCAGDAADAESEFRFHRDTWLKRWDCK